MNIKDDSGEKISDNPTAKELRSILPFFRLLGSAAGFAARLGIKRDAMASFKSSVDELMASADILELPDRFNAAFANQGWIATNSFAVDAMRAAVEFHGKGNTEQAESSILDWFTQENIQLFAIIRSRRYHIAHLRHEQLEEALRLYLEGRYMAAVPLILIACDGFASDVSGISPFEKNADLTCFDSIAGHHTSLPALMKLFVQGVRKSTDAELNIPKRHGILHGRSLGYANKIVCAKAWLLMVALVDWAEDKSLEEARIEGRRKKDSTSWRDTFEKTRQLQIDKKIIDEFQPSESIGPYIGPYDSRSVEYALIEFLEGWQKRNFGRMSKHVINMTKKPTGKMAGEIRNMVEFVTLEEYEIICIRRSTVARCDVRVRIQAKTLSKTVSGEFRILAFRCNGDGDVAMPADQDCIWAVQQNCIYHVMSENFADLK